MLIVIRQVITVAFVTSCLIITVSCYLFTDSACVLYWLETTKPLSVFVANRVKEIKSLGGVTFSHVTSKDNPADMATRGRSPDELSSSIWWNGPLWLTKSAQQWPHTELVINERTKGQAESEVSGNKILYEAKLVSGEDSSEDQDTQPLRY